jgi:hypothetical protein
MRVTRFGRFCSARLSLNAGTEMRRPRGSAPQGTARGRIGRSGFTLLGALTLLWVTGGARQAGAEPVAGAPQSLRVVAVAPVGSAIHRERSWDGGFGGEIVAGSLADGRALAGWGAAAGGVVFAEAGGGRIWLELAAATRWPLGFLVGLAAGPTVALDELRHPRVGAQATAWVYAGVSPYVRVGSVADSGAFVELGVRVPLPVLRW